MKPNAEGIASRSLRKVLKPLSAGASIEESGEFSEFQSALERVLQTLLAKEYDTWRSEGVDGFRFGVARKLGPEEAEFAGLLLLVGNQSWIPMHLRIRLAQEQDEFEWLECNVGEDRDDDEPLAGTLYGSNREAKSLHSVLNRLESIPWAFQITRGRASDAG